MSEIIKKLRFSINGIKNKLNGSKEEYLEGMIIMVNGLDHHFKQHYNYEKKYLRYLEKWSKQIEAVRSSQQMNEDFITVDDSYVECGEFAEHEAIAYINRLGQLYYFFKSEWFHALFCLNIYKSRERTCGESCELRDILQKNIPMILALMPLRNKISAHRQQDYPHKDDIKHLGANVNTLKAMGVGKVGKKLSHICYSFPTDQRLLENCPAITGVEYLGVNNIVVFEPSVQHQRIMNEIVTFIDFCLEKVNVCK